MIFYILVYHICLKVTKHSNFSSYHIDIVNVSQSPQYQESSSGLTPSVSSGMNTPYSSSAFTSPVHNNSLGMQQSISAYPGTSYDNQHHASSSHHRQSQSAVTSAGGKACVEEHQPQGESQHDSSVVVKSRSTPSPGPVFSSVASVTPPLVSQVFKKNFSFNCFSYYFECY